mgnify:CR=1 FL=1
MDVKNRDADVAYLIEDKIYSEIQSKNTIVCNVCKIERDEGIVNHHQSTIILLKVGT